MRRGLRSLAIFLSIVTSVLGVAAADHEVEGIVHELVAESEGAANIVFGPDGTLYYAEVYAGDVYALAPGAREPELVFSLDVIGSGESGLLGLELARDFDASGAFYVYYVAPEDGTEHGESRLARIVPGEAPEVLLRVPAAQYHNGGRLAWTADGHLLIGTGENNEYAVARDPNDLRGKVLRVTPEGKPAEGNPFGNEVYTMGHRNVYGLVHDAERDLIVITENGESRADELNVLVPGKDYGWPGCEGHCDADWARDFVQPTIEWAPITAPTGIEMLGGAYWVGMFATGNIHRLQPPAEGDGAWTDEVVYEAASGVLDLAPGPEGNTLYYAQWSGIHRLTLPDRLLGVSDGSDPPTTPTPTPTPDPEAPDTAADAATPTPTGSPPEGLAPEADVPGPGADDAARKTPGAGALLVGSAIVVALALARRTRR